ncbi:MAG: imidazolonepropionase [Bryobacteraceae bacterium]
MTSAILVRGARQLLTLRGSDAARRGASLRQLGLIEDGSLIIRDGKVAAVGTTRRIENLAEARDAREIDATGRVVMPGFVDSHTHLVFGPPRLDDYEMRLAGKDYHEIAAAGGGILSSVRAVRTTSSRALLRETRRRVDAFVRHGTTTIEAKSGYGLDESNELKCLRVLAGLDGNPLDIHPTYLGAHVVPPEYAGFPDEYIDWVCSNILPNISRRRLARFVDVYIERGAFGLDDARRYLETARSLGFLLKAHAEQFSNSGGARLAVELGALSVDHLEHAGREDVAVISGSSTIATLLPGSVFHMGLDRYAPARELIDRGAAVALATDFNPGTSPTCSMPVVISLACNEMRMTPAEAITAATINGAHALGCADRAGSLEVGKQADLLLLDASDYREIPYHFGMNLVVMTIKKSQILYRQGEVECPEKS